ncbi:MAG: lysoplasmalogenase family protein [Erysipelotrichaceae bacterium]|nr:lysoplasmalogenase family protein [Erysipelotrichaceae bacterium]
MTGFALGTSLVLSACSLVTYFKSGKPAGGGKRSYRKVFAVYAVITVLAAIAVRVFQQQRPDELFYGAGLKFTASLPPFLYALKGCQLQKTRFGLYILLAIVPGMFADIAINIGFAVGGVFFLVGHLLYDFAFQNDRRPSRKQVLLWLALSVLMILPVFLFREKIGSTLTAVGTLIYISILISTVVFSFRLDKMIFTAAVIFALSDCFMICNIVTNGPMLLRILALLVYYGSLLLYGAVLWKRAQ